MSLFLFVCVTGLVYWFGFWVCFMDLLHWFGSLVCFMALVHSFWPLWRCGLHGREARREGQQNGKDQNRNRRGHLGLQSYPSRTHSPQSPGFIHIPLRTHIYVFPSCEQRLGIGSCGCSGAVFRLFRGGPRCAHIMCVLKSQGKTSGFPPHLRHLYSVPIGDGQEVP